MTDKPQRSDAQVILWVVGGMFAFVAVIGVLAWLAWSFLSPVAAPRTALPPGARPPPVMPQSTTVSLDDLPANEQLPTHRAAWTFVDRFFRDGPEATRDLTTAAFAEQFPIEDLEAYLAALVASSGAYVEQDAGSLQQTSRARDGSVEFAEVSHGIVFTRVRRGVTVRMRPGPDSDALLVDGFEVSGGADPLVPAPQQGLEVEDLVRVFVQALAARDTTRALEFSTRELRWAITAEDLRWYADAVEALAGKPTGDPAVRASSSEEESRTGAAVFDVPYANGNVRWRFGLSAALGGALIQYATVERIADQPVELPIPGSAKFRAHVFLAALLSGDAARAHEQCGRQLQTVESPEALAERVARVSGRLGEVAQSGPWHDAGETRRDGVVVSLRYVRRDRHANGDVEARVQVSLDPAGVWRVSSFEFDSVRRDED